MVVTTAMHHDRAVDHIVELEPGREHGLAGIAVAVDIQSRQVTQMAVAPRLAMLAAVVRVQVPARGLGGHHLAVLQRRRAGGLVCTWKPRRRVSTR